MKRNVLKSLFILCGMFFALNASADGLYISNFNTLPNTATTVSVKMKNTNVMSGFQFDLVLPSGVTLNSVTASSARTSYNYTINQKTQNDGSIRIACVSSASASAVFTGTDGEVLKLSLTSTGAGDKTLTLKNQVLTESDLDEIEPTTATTTMHVHALTATAAKAATCTEAGNKAYWYCSGCKKYYSDATATTETTLTAMTIAALGHKYGSPVWTWAADCSTASAVITCSNDKTHTLSGNATVTSAVKTAATCTAKGTTTYTAKVTLNGTEYSDSKDVENIDALGHDISSIDNGNGTHTTACSRCDYSVTEKHTNVNGVCPVCGATENVGIEQSTDVSKYTNIMYFEDITAKAGASFSLPLKMKNSEENITAFQCDVYLPEGVTWDSSTDARGKLTYKLPTFNEERTDATYHTITPIAKNADGSYSIIVYSMNKEVILDTDGIIMNLPLTVSDEIEKGDYNVFIKNIVMTNVNTEQTLIDKVVSILTVPSYVTGDANGDDMINVTDIVAIISYIRGEQSADFIKEAADVNGDGLINVTDIVGVIDIIRSNN